MADEDPVVVAHVDLVAAAMHQTEADSTVPVVVEQVIETNGAEAAAVSSSFQIKGEGLITARDLFLAHR